jgi:hypothetical protein
VVRAPAPCLARRRAQRADHRADHRGGPGGGSGGSPSGGRVRRPWSLAHPGRCPGSRWPRRASGLASACPGPSGAARPGGWAALRWHSTGGAAGG